MRWDKLVVTRWYDKLSKEKQGYLLIIIFLGIGVSGVGIIYAHSVDNPYRGIGYWGIHSVEDGSIHIPGDIIFASGENHTHTITHMGMDARTAAFPNTNGTVLLMITETSRPACTTDLNGQLYWDGDDVTICAGEDWWILHTIHEP